MVKSAVKEVEEVEEGGNSRDTVLVGCNVPNGLVLRCFTKVTRKVQVLGGGERDEEVYLPDPKWPEVKLNGPAVPWGQHPQFDVKNGYAFTTVRKAFWDRWAPWNKDLIASKSVICGADQDVAFGKAKDYKDARSGLQPLRRKKDPRVKIQTRPEVAITEEQEVLAD